MLDGHGAQGMPSALTAEDLACLELLRTAQHEGAQVRLDAMCRVLKRVIIENHNYCNRRCPFCTNRLVDRRSRQVAMPESTFVSVFNQLKLGRFTGTVFFGRFSEPLADPIIYERIQLVRERLPGNRISLNTNGDYLGRRDLQRLTECGLTDMKIMCYLPDDVVFSDIVARQHCERLIHRYGLDASPDESSTADEVVYVVRHPAAMRISIHAENYLVVGLGSDRGGALPRLAGGRRTAPCHAPHFELNIDYSADVVPCCNMNSDLAAHRPFVMGNAGTQSLADIYFSPQAAAFRQSIAAPLPSPDPCRRCHYYWPNRVRVEERRPLEETL